MCSICFLNFIETLSLPMGCINKYLLFMQGAVSSSITTRGSNDFVEMPVDFESGKMLFLLDI